MLRYLLTLLFVFGLFTAQSRAGVFHPAEPAQVASTENISTTPANGIDDLQAGVRQGLTGEQTDSVKALLGQDVASKFTSDKEIQARVGLAFDLAPAVAALPSMLTTLE